MGQCYPRNHWRRITPATLSLFWRFSWIGRKRCHSNKSEKWESSLHVVLWSVLLYHRNINTPISWDNGPKRYVKWRNNQIYSTGALWNIFQRTVQAFQYRSCSWQKEHLSQLHFGISTHHFYPKWLILFLVSMTLKVKMFALNLQHKTIKKPKRRFNDYRALQFSLNLGTDGVAYSSIAQSFLTLLVSVTFALCSIGMRPWELLKINLNEFSWMKTWTKQGLFSGLDSFIRNSVYLVVVIRAMNLLEQQDASFDKRERVT